MPITQKQKLARYNDLANRVETLELALYDLANSRFGKPIVVDLMDHGWLDRDYKGNTKLKVSLSMRGMPLYYVTSKHGDTTNVDVYTDNQVMDAARDHSSIPYWRAVVSARNTLLNAAMEVK